MCSRVRQSTCARTNSPTLGKGSPPWVTNSELSFIISVNSSSARTISSTLSFRPATVTRKQMLHSRFLQYLAGFCLEPTVLSQTATDLSWWRHWGITQGVHWRQWFGFQGWGPFPPGVHTDGPDRTPGSPQKVHGSNLHRSQQYYHLQIKITCFPPINQTTKQCTDIFEELTKPFRWKWQYSGLNTMDPGTDHWCGLNIPHSHQDVKI